MIITIPLFFLALLFIFFLPGRFVLRLSKFNFDNLVVSSACALTTGICLFLLTTYLFSWIEIPLVGSVAMFLLSLFEIRHIIQNKKKIEIKNVISFEAFILLVGSFAMAYIMWWSGMPTENGLAFYSINAADGIFHISLIGNLMHHFPPTHAGLDGIFLRGYHFFYDLLLANFAVVFGFSTLDLYFRLFPFFIAFFYGLSGFALAKFLKLSKLSTRIFLFLLYFAEGFGFFITQYFASLYSTGIIQSIAHILDPNVLFSLGILFCAFILIFNTKNIFQIVITAIIIGVLPNIKIYTAVIVFGAFFVTSILALLRDKKSVYIKIFFLSSLVASLIYLPINFGVGKLVFAPFLLYTHFMESAFLFSKFEWGLKYQFYLYDGNYLRLGYLLFIALFLFFIPSLGLRIVSLRYIPRLFKKDFYILPRVFWLSAVSIAFFIPTFFIQNIAVFVIIQFLWFGYILLLLPTSITFGQLLNKAHIFIIILFFGVLIFLSIHDIFISVKTFTQNPTFISKDIISMANFIHNKVSQDKAILLLNRDKKENVFVDLYSVPIISALSMHSVYYEPEVLNFSGLEGIISKRKDIIDTIQKITYTCDVASIANGKITTLIKKSASEYLLTYKSNSCFDRMHNFVKVHKEGDVSLYKIL